MLHVMAVEPRKDEALILHSFPDNPEKKFLLSLSNKLTLILCMTSVQPAKLEQSYMVNDLTLTFIKLHIHRLHILTNTSH